MPGRGNERLLQGSRPVVEQCVQGHLAVLLTQGTPWRSSAAQAGQPAQAIVCPEGWREGGLEPWSKEKNSEGSL